MAAERGGARSPAAAAAPSARWRLTPEREREAGAGMGTGMAGASARAQVRSPQPGGGERGGERATTARLALSFSGAGGAASRSGGNGHPHGPGLSHASSKAGGAVSEASFHGDGADVGALLAQWMSLDQLGGAGATADAGDGADHGAPFVGAERMAKLLGAARADVGQLRREAKARAIRLEREAVAAEAAATERMGVAQGKGGAGAGDPAAELMRALDALEGRIAHVAHTAVRVGQRLRRADGVRARALEAAELIEQLRAFAACDGDLANLPPLFTDDSRAAEAAQRAVRLLSVAQMVAEQARGGGGGGSDGGSGTHARGGGRGSPAVPGGAGAGGAGLDGDAVLASGAVQVRSALRSLEAYVEALENRVAARFDEAREQNDVESMRVAAVAAADFGACERLARRYVASCPMFIDAAVLEQDMKSARAGPGAQGLRPTFRDIMDTATKDAVTIEAVFPDAASAKEAYLTRVLEQRVGGLLEVLLLDAHDGALPIAADGATSGKFGRMSTFAAQVSDADKVLAGGGSGSAYIRTLASAHEMTLELAKQLAESGAAGSLDAVGLAASLFHERRGGYVDDEISSLLRLSADAQAVREDSESVGPAGNRDLVARAKQTVAWHRDACARCESVLRSEVSATRASAGMRLLELFLEQTCGIATQVAGAAAEHGRAQCEALDRADRSGSFTSNVAGANDFPPGDLRGLGALLSVVEGAQAVASESAAHVSTALLPLIPQRSGEAGDAESMLARASSQLQTACLAVLQQATCLACAHARALLKSLQEPTDFCPEGDDVLEAKPTEACECVVAALREVAALAAGSLREDGERKQQRSQAQHQHQLSPLQHSQHGHDGDAPTTNFGRFMAAVGTGIAAALEEHIFGGSRGSFSALGAVRLRRDLNEYACAARDTHAHAFAATADSLGERATLLVVSPGSVAALLRGELRGVVTPVEAQKVLKLREDARSTSMAAALREIAMLER